MAHGNFNFNLGKIENFYNNNTRMNPTWLGGADVAVCNAEDRPRDCLGSSTNHVPQSGIRDNMERGELQQSEPGPDGPLKTTEEDFKQLDKLGCGSYGKVMLVRKTRGEHLNQLFAMKISKKPIGYKSAKCEKETLKKCKHPFIVSLFYAFQTASKFCLVLEYVPGGDLMTYIRRNYIVPEEYARFYCSEIILAIEYLHGLSILYRDLKPDNVLICADGHIKLADFGMCKKIKQSSKYKTVGTRGFIAPEMFKFDASWRATYGKAVDWWSMGVLIFRMLLGQMPFQSVADRKYGYLHHILTVHLRDDGKFLEKLSEEAQELITQLLAVNACDRLGGGPDDAVSIKNHLFFRSINWDDVLQKRYKPPYAINLESETDTSAFDPKIRQQMSDDDPNVEACDDNFEGFSYVAPSSFDGLPKESGSCQGPQPRRVQVPSRSISPCLAEAIHQIQVVRDHTASSPRFDAHQQAKAYPAVSNTPQILPSNLSYNPSISNQVKESHRQRYARMDHFPVAPMFGHHNFVPPPPGFNMVQNPTPEYYNASTRGPFPEPVEGFSYVAPSSFDGLSEKSGSCRGPQPRLANVPSRSINHCPTEAIHPIQVVGDHTASSPRFDAHQQATAYPAKSNTPQMFPSSLPYNPHISDPVNEFHRQSYARMNYTPVAPMFGHHNLVPPPPGFNMVQIPPPEYYNASTRQFMDSAQPATRHGANVVPTYRRPLGHGGIGVVGPTQVCLGAQPTLNNGCTNVVMTTNNQHISARWPYVGLSSMPPRP